MKRYYRKYLKIQKRAEKIQKENDAKKSLKESKQK